MPEYRDWLGNLIEVGSPVLYAISEGHFAKVVWAEVLEILPVEDAEPYFNGFRNFKLKVQPYYENVDVLNTGGFSSPRGISFSYDSEAEHGHYERVLPKPAFVKNVEKVTVFPLPDGVRERFEAILDERVEQGNKRFQRRTR